VANTISDASIMAALGRQMTRAVAREAVATGNLANIDTPGYHTRDVSFDQALTDRLNSATLSVSSSGTTGASQTAGAATSAEGKVTETDGLPERRDGNNVQLDRELLSLTRASGDFSAAQAVLSAKFRLVRYAINDGR
jgi:flagellar basal-body rod protein FlgB